MTPHIINLVHATADNKVLEVNTQGFCPFYVIITEKS